MFPASRSRAARTLSSILTAEMPRCRGTGALIARGRPTEECPRCDPCYNDVRAHPMTQRAQRKRMDRGPECVDLMYSDRQSIGRRPRYDGWPLKIQARRSPNLPHLEPPLNFRQGLCVESETISGAVTLIGLWSDKSRPVTFPGQETHLTWLMTVTYSP